MNPQAAKETHQLAAFRSFLAELAERSCDPRIDDRALARLEAVYREAGNDREKKEAS